MTEWIIPCNPKQYDIIGAFNEFDRIHWKQGANYEIGDKIYIYVSKEGHHRIEYLCVVNRIDITERDMKDQKYILNGENFLTYGKYMELVKIEQLDTHLLSWFNLQENGLTGKLQGPTRIKDPVLSSYIFASTTTRLGQEPNKGPDSEHNLKEIIQILLRAYNSPVPRKYLTGIIYPPDNNNHSANLTVPLQTLKNQNKITWHADNTLELNDDTTPSYYYVFQNKTFEKERKGGYLIANKKNDKGAKPFWTLMKDVKKASCKI